MGDCFLGLNHDVNGLPEPHPSPSLQSEAMTGWSEPQKFPHLLGESVIKETDMRKSRFSEEQIIAILAEQERGMTTAEVCRKHGISQNTFYIYGCLSRCKVSLELN